MIIAGFGRFGQIVARVLRMKGLSFTALDSSQTHVDFVRRFGNKVYYGDATRLDLLRAAGAQSARVLVLAVDDVDASVRTATVVREQFPQLRIFARARNRQHAFALMDAGVSAVIRETYAGSLEMAAAVLEALGETPAVAREAVRRFRQHDEQTLAAQYQVKEDEEKFLATTREAAAAARAAVRGGPHALGNEVAWTRRAACATSGSAGCRCPATQPEPAAALLVRRRRLAGAAAARRADRRALRPAVRARRCRRSSPPGRMARGGG